nr:fibronectin type III domain-containing protein [Thermoplasmata archaeon]NIS11812.1 fibronectin type III domain-containing protein [Thermoplasmata archaeon]NIS19695.1 fibronectin type III domain-containing protein [Thermoplasmata archaeon]NIT76878.1 fibronectin type III domain-containing protein [Thermoplasmata archaeon]NIU48806.1 fibronectin type III domain-containing protein [Thermoplasmata archaeon]
VPSTEVAPPPPPAKPPEEKAKPPAKKKAPPSELGKASGIPLIAPGFLDGSFKDGAVALKWKRPIGEEAGNIKGYRILRWYEGSDLEQVGEVKERLEFNDKDVQKGIAYNYAVQAFNDRGQSDASNWIEITAA